MHLVPYYYTIHAVKWYSYYPQKKKTREKRPEEYWDWVTNQLGRRFSIP